jgi:hypothetical protein
MLPRLTEFWRLYRGEGGVGGVGGGGITDDTTTVLSGWGQIGRFLNSDRAGLREIDEMHRGGTTEEG